MKPAVGPAFNLVRATSKMLTLAPDLGLRYAASGKTAWYVDAFVRNAGDGNVKTSALNGFGPWMAQYLPPRTYGINVGLDLD
jgi:iron complex outermembrane receptor protein